MYIYMVCVCIYNIWREKYLQKGDRCGSHGKVWALLTLKRQRREVRAKRKKSDEHKLDRLLLLGWAKWQTTFFSSRAVKHHFEGIFSDPIYKNIGHFLRESHVLFFFSFLNCTDKIGRNFIKNKFVLSTLSFRLK